MVKEEKSGLKRSRNGQGREIRFERSRNGQGREIRFEKITKWSRKRN